MKKEGSKGRISKVILWLKKNKRNIAILIICLVIVYAVGAIGSFFTESEVNGHWYNQVKPTLTPPNWVFPIVWNFLFLFIALALFCSWIHATTKKQKKLIILVYGINLVLNILWSFFYFGLKNPALALLDLAFIWVSILWMMCVSCQICSKVAYFLAPYLIWITFAGILNYQTITGMSR